MPPRLPTPNLRHLSKPEYRGAYIIVSVRLIWMIRQTYTWSSSMNSSFLVSCIKFSTRYWISHAIVGCFPSLVFAGIARLCFRSLAKSISKPPLHLRGLVAIYGFDVDWEYSRKLYRYGDCFNGLSDLFGLCIGGHICDYLRWLLYIKVELRKCCGGGTLSTAYR